MQGRISFLMKPIEGSSRISFFVQQNSDCDIGLTTVTRYTVALILVMASCLTDDLLEAA